ncbi:hypothetical protein [Halalkalicoccus tibetensis]|uniref:Uncharacterized protein n=1 Tax=Halalkalicoccus tibetensis TaxID=175632 RepID=A0ABD5UXY5_9EURY
MVRLDATAAGRGFIVAGLVHLLAPGLLIDAARYAYDRVLSAEFDGGRETNRRLRAVGLVLLALGTVVASDDRSVSVALSRT